MDFNEYTIIKQDSSYVAVLAGFTKYEGEGQAITTQWGESEEDALESFLRSLREHNDN